MSEIQRFIASEDKKTPFYLKSDGDVANLQHTAETGVYTAQEDFEYALRPSVVAQSLLIAI